MLRLGIALLGKNKASEELAKASFIQIFDSWFFRHLSVLNHGDLLNSTDFDSEVGYWITTSATKVLCFVCLHFRAFFDSQQSDLPGHSGFAKL